MCAAGGGGEGGGGDGGGGLGVFSFRMAWRLGARPTVSAPPVRVGEAAEESLPSVRRDFYLEHPVVAAMTPEAAEAERARLGILVHGSSACPNPVGSFLQASFPQYVLDALAKADFLEPTPIQRQAWPIAMQGSDLVGLAETGSGKTLAFLLPAIVHVNAQPVLEEGDGPLALILAPTRELAVQIADECVRFGHPCGVSTLCVYGGVPKQPQVQALRKAPEVLVATPGRLNDLLSSRKTELSRCTYFVVDEADRMLDLGFEPQLRSVLTHMRADRQTLFFSATWPAEVQELASRLLLPGSITVEVGGALTDAGKANRRISQLVVMCSADDKLSTLVRPRPGPLARPRELAGGAVLTATHNRRVAATQPPRDCRATLPQPPRNRVGGPARGTNGRVADPRLLCVQAAVRRGHPCAAAGLLAGPRNTRRQVAGGARLGAAAVQGRPRAPPRRHGRGTARPRHQGRPMRRQLRLPRDVRVVRAPDRPDRARGERGHRVHAGDPRRRPRRPRPREGAPRQRPAGARPARRARRQGGR